jgi:hypothetical protein
MLLEDRQAAVKRTPPHQTLLSLGDVVWYQAWMLLG